MKKFGFLALALGLFVAACNNAGTTNTADSTAAADSLLNAAQQTVDSAAQVVDSAAQVVDSTAKAIDSTAKAQ